ncbi:MAG: UDP-2-acetamido-2-deoxy-3-oxo-D-glucuronate aminotransferase [Chloroflexi bacterium ADurb.Bin325]|nr:MAG: UDP-2-acetamido-2-deoxy-3-oxo-D-glucuronate aminotransferase [Chloroflexi bacterium ADurb.Bin325]
MSEAIPLVDLRAQYAVIREEVTAAMQRVLDSAGFIMGPEVSNFEAAFARYIGAREAVGVASGTAALHLALLACGVGPGDEVITTTFTFYATAEAIAQAGATPVFVDIRPDTYNMDVTQLAAALTPRTRAIIPVHLYGQAAEMAAIGEFARQHGLWVIEDAAQAHAAEHRGQRCGTLGDIACFSFFPSKNLGCYGDGGMVTSNNPELAARVRRLRDHGRIAKYEHAEMGWAYRLDALQAAVLDAKLPHLDAWIVARRRAARYYTELLADVPVGLPVELPDNRHVYHLYVVRSQARDALVEHLHRAGIGASIHYPLPLHLQPVYRDRGWGPGSFPAAEAAAAEVLSLPLYAEITPAQQERVAAAIRQFSSG